MAADSSLRNPVSRIADIPPERAISATNDTPSVKLLIREGASLAYIKLTAGLYSAQPLDIKGDGRPVVVIPGFMANDQSTARIRATLSASGFDVHGWGMGRNNGLTEEILQHFHKHIENIGSDMPVTLVGWSLGGLLAREYAKQHPRNIAKVITMGSPFSGSPRANNVWRLYEYIAGYKVDNPPVNVNLHEKPPVPTIAIWSARDGVIAPSAACGQSHESDTQIQVDCGHIAFVSDIHAFRQVAKAIVA